MDKGLRPMRRAATRRAGWPSTDSICKSCRARLSAHSRQLATVAHSSPSSSLSPLDASQVASTELPRPVYSVRAGVVLSRPPLLTRSLTPFEESFYLYQRRLNERLALPFTRYFYYKKGTPADEEWKRKARHRPTAARDIGLYTGYGTHGWNDEVLMGDATSEPKSQIDALINDARGLTIDGKDPMTDAERANQVNKKDQSQEIVVQAPLNRVTAADERGDTTSLDRLLHRTLFLLMKNEAGRWTFPEDAIQGREGLHDAAERVLVQAGGINMNTWVVGNAPIGHYHYEFPKAVVRTRPANTSHKKTTALTEVPTEIAVRELGEKVFYLKARIMAGQADMSKNVLGHSEYQWLAKDEIQGVVTPLYWSAVRHMLADR